MTTQTKQEPTYDDIMAKLELIEKRIMKVDKRTSGIQWWLWAVMIGALVSVLWP